MWIIFLYIMRKLLFIFFLFFGLNLHSWGWIAHMAVGEVATVHLTDKTRAAVFNILHGSGYTTLREIAPTPDHNRGSDALFPWIKCDPNNANCQDVDIVWHDAPSFHFLDYADVAWDGKQWNKLESEEQVVDFAKDWHSKCDGSVHCTHDAYTETLNAIKILSSPHKTIEQKRVALIWVTHLVGDLSQPLHLGRTSDKGANDIKIVYYKRHDNLHYLWDTGVIEHHHLSPDSLAAAASNRYNTCCDNHSKSLPDLSKYSLFNLLQDSVSLLKFAYDDSLLPNNPEKFDEQVLPMIKDQIFNGGIALANILNSIFDS